MPDYVTEFITSPCLVTLKNLNGGDLPPMSKKNTKVLIDAVAVNLKHMSQENKIVNQKQAVNDAIDRIVKKIEKLSKEKVYIAYKKFQVREVMVTQLDNFAKDYNNKAKVTQENLIRHLLVGSEQELSGVGDNVAANIRAVVDFYKIEIHNMYRKAGLRHLVDEASSRKNPRDGSIDPFSEATHLHLELLNTKNKANIETLNNLLKNNEMSVEGKKAAKIMKHISDKQNKELFNNGVITNYLDGYVIKNSYNGRHLETINTEAFIDKMIDLYDWKAIEQKSGRIVKDKRKFVKAVYDNATGENDYKNTIIHNKKGSGFGSGGERVVIYKAGAFSQGYRMYGRNNIFDDFRIDAITKATKLGIISRMGSDFEGNLEYALSRIINKYKNVKGYDNIAKKLPEGYTKPIFNVLTGLVNLKDDDPANAVIEGIKAFSVVKFLGLSQLSSIFGDSLTISFSNKLKGTPFGETLSTIGSALFPKRLGNERNLDLAHELAVMFNGLHDTSSRFGIELGNETGNNRISTQIARKFLGIIGQRKFTNEFRYAVRKALAMEGYRMSRLEFDKVPPLYKLVLKRYGISAEEWTVIGLGGRNIEGLRGGAVSPNSIKQVTTENVIKKFPNMSEKKAQELINESSRKWAIFGIGEEERSIMQHTAQASARLTGGLNATSANNHFGKALPLYTFLMTMPVVTYQKIFSRIMLRGGHENVYQKQALKENITLLSAYLTSAIMVGFLLGISKDAARKLGNDVDFEFKPENIGRYILLGGGIGIPSDILSMRWGNSWGDNVVSKILLSPIADTIIQLFAIVVEGGNLSNDALHNMVSSDDDDVEMDYDKFMEAIYKLLSINFVGSKVITNILDENIYPPE